MKVWNSGSSAELAAKSWRNFKHESRSGGLTYRNGWTLFLILNAVMAHVPMTGKVVVSGLTASAFDDRIEHNKVLVNTQSIEKNDAMFSTCLIATEVRNRSRFDLLRLWIYWNW